MATRGLDIGDAWVEIGAGLSMVDGTTYVVDLQGGGENASIRVHHTDVSDVPADDADGQILWSSHSKNRDADREYTKKSGRYSFARSTVGTVRLVISEV